MEVPGRPLAPPLTPVPCDRDDLNLFAACSKLTLGDGDRINFWGHRWLEGMAPKDYAPGLFALARSKSLTVKEALLDGRWMKGLARIDSQELMDSFINLWCKVQTISLSSFPDSIRWTLTADGKYSASSAYGVQFLSRIPIPMLAKVWNIRAEMKVKFFIWTLLQNRLWTADRLSRRGWPHNEECSLCDQTLESAKHILLDCPFAKEVWHLAGNTCAAAASCALSAPTVNHWWNVTRGRGPCVERALRMMSARRLSILRGIFGKSGMLGYSRLLVPLRPLS